MKMNKGFKTITIFIILLTIYGAGFGVFTWNALRASSEKIDAADAIIILTGGENRIKEGLALLDKQRTKGIFISGVGVNNTLKDIVSNDTYNKVKDYVTLGLDAQNTIGNAKESYDWLEKNKNIKSFNIVTSTYHMPRARYLFSVHPSYENYKISTYSVAMERLSPYKREFWNLMLNEYNKFAYTWFMSGREINLEWISSDQ